MDLDALQRQFKPEQRTSALKTRPATENASAVQAVGTKQLLLDTNVYIYKAARDLPQDAIALLDGALRFHSSLCMSEITLGISFLNPLDKSFKPAWDYYDDLFRRIPSNRIHSPT